MNYILSITVDSTIEQSMYEKHVQQLVLKSHRKEQSLGLHIFYL